MALTPVRAVLEKVFSVFKARCFLCSLSAEKQL